MKIEFAVRLPVDTHSVPFVRSLCRQALEHLAVDRHAIEEIVLALTEACANVVEHAANVADYEVVVAMETDVCRISVIDTGQGFDPSIIPAVPDPAADGGHGLLLMRALVDQLDFRRDPDGRHRVTLEKRLGMHSGSPSLDPA